LENYRNRSSPTDTADEAKFKMRMSKTAGSEVLNLVHFVFGFVWDLGFGVWDLVTPKSP
jgi:hypothetical protein